MIVRKTINTIIPAEAYSMKASWGSLVQRKICSGRVVVGSFMIECGVALEKNAIPIIINGAVSPAALAIESKIPVIIRGIERGRVTINVA